MSKIKVIYKNAQINVRSKLDRNENIDDRELNVLVSTVIRGLMRVQAEGRKKLVYCAPEGIPLKDYLANGLDRNQFLDVFVQFIELIQKINAYQLRVDNLILDLKYVYINEKTKAVHFIYQPLCGPTDSPYNIFSFIYEMIRVTELLPGEDESFLNDLYRYLKGMQYFSADDMEQYIRTHYPESLKRFFRQETGENRKKYGEFGSREQSGSRKQPGNRSYSGGGYSDYDERGTTLLDDGDDFDEGNTVLLDEMDDFEEENTALLDEIDDFRGENTVLLDEVNDYGDETGLLRDDGTGLMRDDETGLLRDDGTGLMWDDETGLLRDDETGLLRDDETGLLREEETGLLRDDETGLLRDDETGLLYEDKTNIIDDSRNRRKVIKKAYPYLIRLKNQARIEVNKPVFRIGREKSYVDYFISDNNNVSRVHADIISRDGKYYIRDNNSTNYTYLNGKYIEVNCEIPVTDGDQICLANEEFVFYLK